MGMLDYGRPNPEVANQIYRAYGAGAAEHYMRTGNLDILGYEPRGSYMGIPIHSANDVYSAPDRVGVRTRHQDNEIFALQNELKTKLKEHENKKVSDKKELNDLIAYYYNK